MEGFLEEWKNWPDRLKELSGICKKEFYGLDPVQGYTYAESAEMKGPVYSFLAWAPLVPLALLGGPQLFDLNSDVKKEYEAKALDLATKQSWRREDARTFGIEELKTKKGLERLEDYLKTTAGHVLIECVPRYSESSSSEGASYDPLEGGFLRRPVKEPCNLSFYADDGVAARAYFGLPSSFEKAKLHLVAAKDSEEPVVVGIQLDTTFDLVGEQYAVQYIEFTKESIYFGSQSYFVVSRDKVKELAESKKSRKEKNRIFRAILELGLVY